MKKHNKLEEEEKKCDGIYQTNLRRINVFAIMHTI